MIIKSSTINLSEAGGYISDLQGNFIDLAFLTAPVFTY